MKAQIKFLIGTVIIMMGLFFWFSVGINEVNKMPTNYSIFITLEGEDQILEVISGKLNKSNSIHEIFQKVINIEGNTLEIESKYIGRNLDNGKIIFNSTDIFYVDRTTRQHTQNYFGYFVFSQNVQKQDYEFFHPIVLGQGTFVFEGVEKIHNLEVYEFSCETSENDLSYAYTQFEPSEIWYDGKCKIWVEPNTGKTVDFELDWDIYFVENGIRTGDVEIGGMSISDDVKFVLAQNAISLKNLHYNNNVILPLLTAIVSFAILIGVIMISEKTKTSIRYQEQSVLVKKLEESTKIISSQLKKNKELENAKIKNERLIAIGELSSRISHDIRNPLSILYNEFDLMKYRNILNEKQIKRIGSSLKRISHQIDEVLDFVRITPMHYSQVNLSKIIHNSLKSIKIPSEVKINIASDDIFMKSDERKLEIVFINLILNAIQAMENNGTIDIILTETKTTITIEIIDSGPGIITEPIENIFNPLISRWKSNSI